MTAKSKSFGVGTRDGQVFLLDPTTGLPYQATSSTTMEEGQSIEGIKTFAVTDPPPRRFTHIGNDRALASDSLPATELMSIQISTSKTNKTLDAFLEGNLVRTYTNLQLRVQSGDRKGREPQVAYFVWRQALAADPTDVASFGKVRNYEMQIAPAVRTSVTTPSWGADLADQFYELTPSEVKETPWGEDLLNATFGSKEGPLLVATTDYEPRFYVGKGDGTIVSWTISRQPYSSSHLLVWVGTGGSLTTPGSITYSGTLSAFTIPGTVGSGTPVFALVQSADV